MRYKVHYEDNLNIFDFEIDSDNYIASSLLNDEINDFVRLLGGNTEKQKYLKVEKI